MMEAQAGGSLHMNDVEKREDNLAKPIAILLMLWLLQAAGGLFGLMLAYGVVVIIFRYAFHVELWNPFRDSTSRNPDARPDAIRIERGDVPDRAQPSPKRAYRLTCQEFTPFASLPQPAA
jgi:hypothetical protein